MADKTLDYVAGNMLAAMGVIGLLLKKEAGNDALLLALEDTFEQTRTALLASVQSDDRIHAFEETAQGFLTALREG